MTHPSDAGGEPADTPAARPPVSTSHGADEHGSIRTDLLTVEWHVTRAADVTLVTVHVTNTHDTAREVRLENRLDGPVLPPCRHGVAEAGWDDDGVTRQVPGESRVSVGYACRAPPETPPVDVTDRLAQNTGGDDGTTPVVRALRSLGDHAPPRAVVSREREPTPDDRQKLSVPVAPTPSPAEATRSVDSPPGVAEDECECATGDERTSAADREEETETEGEPAADSMAGTAGAASRSAPTTAASPASPSDRVASASPDSSSEPVPTPVTAWFHSVEARLTTADRLAGDVAEATPVIASLGGRAGVAVLANTLEADAAALAHVAARADELAARAEAADVPDLRGSR